LIFKNPKKIPTASKNPEISGKIPDLAMLLQLFVPFFPIKGRGIFLGGIIRAERNFSLSCDFSDGTN
jgi:hypothetical protein